MDYIIRELRTSEYPLLREFLYEAIFVPEGMQPPPKSCVDLPELQVYIAGFGSQKDDHALAAEAGGKVVGAVWVRIMNDYGHIDDQTPSFAISLYEEYRGLGIGTEMLRAMLTLLKQKSYAKTSLAVQKANRAVKLYRRAGFQIIGENEEEYIMAHDLQEK